MASDSKYSDKRAGFFKDYFSKALPFNEYLQTGDDGQQKSWLDFEKRISLSTQNKEVIQSFIRELNVLVMSGIWCGDCARQGPMINAIADASQVINVRYIDNRENPELQEELKILGAMRVPVVVGLSEDFFEVARTGDRMLSVYRDKAKNELGAACDAGLLPPADELLQAELNEWIEWFEKQQLMLRLAPMLRNRYND